MPETPSVTIERGSDPLQLRVRTARLRLAVPTLSDAAESAQGMTPDVARWMTSWPCPLSKEAAEDRIRLGRSEVIAGTGLHFAIRTAAEDRLAGWTSIWQGEGDKWRVGYWLSTPYQGRGFGFEAGAAILAVGESVVRTPAVEAAVNPANVPSLKLVRKLGMAQVGETLLFVPLVGREEVHLLFERRFDDG